MPFASQRFQVVILDDNMCGKHERMPMFNVTKGAKKGFDYGNNRKS